MKRDLVRLSEVIPGIILDLVYSTNDNFTGKAVYPSCSTAYLCRGPAFRLKNVQESLKKRGLFLKIWDGYRPHSVQKLFWELVPDPRYVGNPATGSKHNRGAAVDVTLVDSTGAELLMQSRFDDFSERAHRSYNSCDQALLENVRILTEAMTAAGFIASSTEWWHFEDPEWADYPLLDISFEELQ